MRSMANSGVPTPTQAGSLWTIESVSRFFSLWHCADAWRWEHTESRCALTRRRNGGDGNSRSVRLNSHRMARSFRSASTRGSTPRSTLRISAVASTASARIRDRPRSSWTAIGPPAGAWPRMIPPEDWFIEIDLGRAVAARKVTLIFDEEAPPFELFTLFLSTGEQAIDVVDNIVDGSLI